MSIEIRNLYKIYGSGQSEFTALKNINLSVKNGELIILKGVSGSGKSTLLSLIGGLSKPSSGEIIVNSQNIAKLPDIMISDYRNREIGFIFQSFNLFNALSVRKNVIAPLMMSKLSSKELNSRVKNAMELANIAHKQDQIVSSLSGGEKQRCAIARALVNSPGIILADEPTANLDRANSLEFIATLAELKKLGKTLIVATHDALFDNLEIADKYLYIEQGEIK